MAAYIRTTTLDLGTNVTHLATDYQISTDPLFVTANIVAESIDDSVNLTQIIFNTVLDPTIKYYARTRVRLNTGYSAWGNVNIFTPKDINDIALDIDIPSNVSLPSISLSHSQSSMPITGFTIQCTGFGVVGTAIHSSTTYIIEDLKGSTIWISENNDYNKTSLHINDVVLRPNRIYRIKVIFNSSSNDSSQIITKTIRTMNSENVRLTKPLSVMNFNVDNYIDIYNIPNLLATELVVYSIQYGETIEIYRYTEVTNPSRLTIPVGTLLDKSKYLVSIKTNLDTENFYGLFSTY